jgi:hypothetical protein
MSMHAALNKAQSKYPLEGFVLCDLLEVAGGISYYGYQSMHGAWIIKSYNDTTGELRYCADDANYATAWSGRASLTYTLPSEA